MPRPKVLMQRDSEIVRDTVSRVGLGDVKAFGMTWEDCEDFLSRLAYRISTFRTIRTGMFHAVIKELTAIISEIAGSHLPIKYKSSGQTFVANLVGDPTAAEYDLAFKWTVDLEEGLKRLIEWRERAPPRF